MSEERSFKVIEVGYPLAGEHTYATRKGQNCAVSRDVRQICTARVGLHVFRLPVWDELKTL